MIIVTEDVESFIEWIGDGDETIDYDASLERYRARLEEALRELLDPEAVEVRMGAVGMTRITPASDHIDMSMDRVRLAVQDAIERIAPHSNPEDLVVYGGLQ